MEWFFNTSFIFQAFIATLFTWGVTALGAACVFFFNKVNQKILDLTLGFASGVMLAASFWSLLNPAIEMSNELGYISWLYPCLGFFFGGLFVIVSDIFLERVMLKQDKNEDKKRSILLVGAITLHNIPEGLAIGVAFASVALNVEGATGIGALLLAIGIGLQNFPEGAGISLPLRREGYSRKKSFLYGQASGIVEPIAGLLGCLMANLMRSILPFLLSFAAGCMIGVVSRELIPESCKENKNHSSIGLIIGFIVMMILDVALG